MIYGCTPHCPKQNEILTLCCFDYTGDVRFVGFANGFGAHGGRIAAVQLLGDEDLPIVMIDSFRLVTKDLGVHGWSRA